MKNDLAGVFISYEPRSWAVVDGASWVSEKKARQVTQLLRRHRPNARIATKKVIGAWLPTEQKDWEKLTIFKLIDKDVTLCY